MWARSFEEQEESSEEEDSSASQEPEYVFEGFTVEYSERVMLTPIAASRSA
jgi:hypothetical protein